MNRAELVGVAIAGAVIVGLAVVFNEENPAPRTPKPAGGGAGVAWRPLGEQIALVKGRRYRACVSVPWPASIAVTAGLIRSRAEREGFVDVRVMDERPRDWPDADCKQFVEATYAGAERVVERPGVGLPEAWELVPANEDVIVA